MTQENNIQIEPVMYVWFKTDSKKPVAFSLETPKVVGLIACLSLAIFLMGIGTLLFFRELEFSRRLGEELLNVKLENQMMKANHLTGPDTSRMTFIGPLPENTVPAVTLHNNATVAPSEKVPRTIATASVSAKLTDLTVDCINGNCQAKVSMVPAKAGAAEGSLLLVLETEILRIGSATPSGQVRRRYYIYPHDQTKEELDESQLSSLARKPFHFSRALQTSAQFKVGTHVRPLALNLYLYDSDGEVIHHERKAVEDGEANVE